MDFNIGDVAKKAKEAQDLIDKAKAKAKEIQATVDKAKADAKKAKEAIDKAAKDVKGFYDKAKGFDFNSLLDKVKSADLSLGKLSDLKLDASQLDFAKLVMDASEMSEKLKNAKSFYSEKLKGLDDVSSTISKYKDAYNSINETVTTLKTILDPTQKIDEMRLLP